MSVPKSKCTGCMCRRETTWTTEVLSQNIAILVLMHEYGRFLGAYIMGI
jgi:hypothetical protein